MRAPALSVSQLTTIIHHLCHMHQCVVQIFSCMLQFVRLQRILVSYKQVIHIEPLVLEQDKISFRPPED